MVSKFYEITTYLIFFHISKLLIIYFYTCSYIVFFSCISGYCTMFHQIYVTETVYNCLSVLYFFFFQIFIYLKRFLHGINMFYMNAFFFIEIHTIKIKHGIVHKFNYNEIKFQILIAYLN